MNYPLNSISQRKYAKRNSRFHIVPLFLLAIFIYALVFSFWQTVPVPLNVHLAAIIIAATSFIPMGHWYTGNRYGLPIFEVIVLSYALQFSIPVYTQPNSLIIFSAPVYIAWEDIFRSLGYVEVGLISLISAYYIARTFFTRLGIIQIDMPLDPDRRTAYLVLAIVGGSSIMILDTLGLLRFAGLSAIVSLIVRQAYVAMILLAYDVFRKREQRKEMIFLLYGAVGLSALVGLTTGLLENALIPLVLLFVVRWHVQQRFPWIWAATGLFLYLVLNPAKFDYRAQVWYGQEQYSFLQRVGLWQDLFIDSAENMFNPVNETIRVENTRSALARFDLIHRFAYVQRLTPAYIPYYEGETYTYFLYAWIPRIVWPNKPSAGDANEIIDTDYRLTTANSSTTYGIGQLPEAYTNFGLVGIVGVMAVQGVVFAFLDRLLNGRNSEGGRAIYLSVMIYFLNGIGSSSAILFGALFQQILVNVLLLRPFSLGFTSANENKPPRGKRLSHHHNK